MNIRITSIQRLCVNDGPGVRTVVFLKGCYLQCPWCCNPEAIHFEGDEYFNRGKCNARSFLCKSCIVYGGMRNKKDCPFAGFEKSYTDYSEEDLYALIMKDVNLYQKGGGVTFSGGEPLLQAESLHILLSHLKENNVNVALETSLYAPSSKLDLIAPYVDYWLVDLKFQYGYIENRDFSIGSKSFFYNLQKIQSSVNEGSICYRMVVMDEVFTQKEFIAKKLSKLGVSNIELLAYHSLAKNKYKELGKMFHHFTTPSKDNLQEWINVMKKYNIQSNFLSV